VCDAEDRHVDHVDVLEHSGYLLSPSAMVEFEAIDESDRGADKCDRDSNWGSGGRP
jgi:hypothetical protein